MNDIRQISVLVVTYNQQNVIGRALDSILQQKDWGLKEIVVCDDCSTDNNWNIIQEYVRRYPGYIRAYRNPLNLGIYGNVEKTIELRGSADLFVELSGDDTFCDGYFKEIQKMIQIHHIDVENDLSIICFDCCVIRPNGVRLNIRTNKKITNSKNPYRLKFRGYIHSRGLVMTKKVLDRYHNIASNKTVTLAESLHEIQPFECADKVYYCPFVANVYYSQIGVSTKMKDTAHYMKDEAKWDFWISNIKLCKTDYYYAMMRKFILSYACRPCFQKFIKIVKYYILSRDKEMPFAPINYFFNIRLIISSTFSNRQ